MDATTLIYVITAVPIAVLFVRAYRRDVPPPDAEDYDTREDS